MHPRPTAGRSRVRRAAIAALAAVALATTVALSGPAPVARAAAPLPVPYGEAAGYAVGLSDLAANPAGSNTWSCKPTAAHPYPVVLVHQTASTAALNWATISPYLKNMGYCVFAVNYGQIPAVPGIGGLGNIDASAQQVAAFVHQVLSATGASKVDMVGHSLGGIESRLFIQDLGGAPEVHTLVLLSSPWDLSTPVTDLEDLIPSPVVQLLRDISLSTLPVTQLYDDPGFWASLNAVDGGASPGVDYATITSRDDEFYAADLASYASTVPGVPLQFVQDACPLAFPDHESIPYNPTAVAMVGNALDPAHAVTPPCQFGP